jgi:hypothetical protein
MADRAGDMARMLLKLHEGEADRLKGLICAAYGLSEAILSDAEDRGGVEPAVLGLKQVAVDAESLVVDVMEKIDTIRRHASGGSEI